MKRLWLVVVPVSFNRIQSTSLLPLHSSACPLADDQSNRSPPFLPRREGRRDGRSRKLGDAVQACAPMHACRHPASAPVSQPTTTEERSDPATYTPVKGLRTSIDSRLDRLHNEKER